MGNIKSIVIYMGAYILTLSLAGVIYSIFKQNKFQWKISRKIFTFAGNILISTSFSLICGLRASCVGYDTVNYINDFSHMALGTYEGHAGSLDYLYKAIFLILAKITKGNQICVLFFMALITMVFVVYALEKVSSTSLQFTILLFLFLLYLSPIMLDQARQLIAVGVVMLAYVYLLNGCKKGYFLYMIIAMLFHETAIAFVLLFFFDNKYLNKKRFGILIGATAILTYFIMPQILNVMFNFVPERFQYITDLDGSGVDGKAWIIDIAPMIMSMIIYYLFKNKDEPKHNIVAEITAWSAFPLRIASYYSFFIMRMSYYGEAVSVVLVSYALKNVKGNKKVLVVIVLLVTYIFRWWYGFVVLKLNNAIPYSFYWQ